MRTHEFDYVAALGSLRRVCTSATLPESRVVVGGLGLSYSLGLKTCTQLDVWVDPLGFELVASAYLGVHALDHGAKILTTWIPNGALVVRTGPWMVKDQDFQGPGRTPIQFRGFTHWNLERTVHWAESRGLVLEADQLRRWQRNAADMMGPHGTAGYLARRRHGKEA